MNERQRRFCELYAAGPNASEAARGAGYSEKTARAQGARLLTNADIVDYIQQLQEALAAARVATITQAKAFWSDIMNDPSSRTADRLKASELLARAAGAFLPPAATPEGIANDVIIYLPKMMTEEECVVTDNE
ncbi:MAG: terminase small subunit [Firmicutes bacterium]|nr:terminase small subunit [Bacillota bacterium]